MPATHLTSSATLRSKTRSGYARNVLTVRAGLSSTATQITPSLVHHSSVQAFKC